MHLSLDFMNTSRMVRLKASLAVQRILVGVMTVLGAFLVGCPSVLQGGTLELHYRAGAGELVLDSQDARQQLLATLDDRETQTGVLRSQAQLQQSDAELRQLQFALKRTQDLKAQGFVSSAALELAESQYKAAKAGRDSAGAATDQAKVTQSFSKITAPYDAWVLETSVQIGDLAMPGKPLLSLYAPQPLRVVMQWPASEKNILPRLQDIQIQIGNEIVKPLSMQVMPNADGVSQTIGIKLDLPKTGVAANAAPGQQVRVRTAGNSQAKGLVPSAAILRRGEITAVYVAQDNGFAMKLVRIGADHGTAGVEIWAGLKEGELIAVDAVQAGMKGAHAAR